MAEEAIPPQNIDASESSDLGDTIATHTHTETTHDIANDESVDIGEPPAVPPKDTKVVSSDSAATVPETAQAPEAAQNAEETASQAARPPIEDANEGDLSASAHADASQEDSEEGSQSHAQTHTQTNQETPEPTSDESKSLPVTPGVGIAAETAPEPPAIEVTGTTESPEQPQAAQPDHTAKPAANLSKEEKVAQINELRLKISTLVSNVRDTKRLCDKYKNENQYLQDYVGSMMASGEMKR